MSLESPRDQLGQDLRRCAMEIDGGQAIQGCRVRIDLRDQHAGLSGGPGQASRRIDERRGADAQKEVAVARRCFRLLQDVGRQRLAEPDDSGTDATATVGAAWRRQALALIWKRRRAGQCIRTSTGVTAGAMQTAVQFQHIRTAGTLMESVDVLGDQSQTRDAVRQLGDRRMGGVRFARQRPAPFVPAPDRP